MAISELDLPTGLVAHSLPDGPRMAEALADRVAETLRFTLQTEGSASLVVSGGKSPVPFFEALSQRELDWSRVQVSLADERRVPIEDPGSNAGLVRRHLLQNQAASAEFIGLYVADVEPEQAADVAARQLAGLKRPIDVLVLGMGDDGHTASLFPGNAALGRALDIDCPELCMLMQAPVAPTERITLTCALLSTARTQILAIQGPGKLEALSQALHADPLQMPIKAFLHHPLEIYWCP